jgi:uncharacterized protein (DUF1800 family)
MDPLAALAIARFGLGRRPDEPVPSDPKAWLLDQVTRTGSAVAGTPTTVEGLTALRADRKNKPAPGESQSRALFITGARTQLAQALSTDTPFRERLVWFWTNHFTVSVRRPTCAAVLPAFVDEAIRPNVTAHFRDLLRAVIRHPAMLIYLDNVVSVGPDSPAGKRNGRGLNENLARECLELHTVTPAAGYTQQDVTAFAAVLTGWSIDLQADPPGYRFRAGAHQPGEQIVMGQRFPAGEAGGVAALDFLGTHRSTYHAIALKLVRYFVSDAPPPDAVARIETILHDTGGDLGAATAGLVALDQAWQPQTKLRTPQDLAIATLRALELGIDANPGILRTLIGLGQPIWAAPAPNGWPDQAADWAAPEAMMRRIDWAYGVAGQANAANDPIPLAQAVLGPMLRPETEDAMRRAGSRRDALTLFLTSPEFQRR